MTAHPMSEHQPGTLMLIVGWAAEPEPICLGVKLGGLPVGDGRETDGALILQGTPYGNSDGMTGEILVNAGDDTRLFDLVALGVQLPNRIDVGVSAIADRSSNRDSRTSAGWLFAGLGGVRISSLKGTFPRVWSPLIDPRTWQVDQSQSHARDGAWIKNWNWILTLPNGGELQIPVEGR
jgi:hypothetical protein